MIVDEHRDVIGMRLCLIYIHIPPFQMHEAFRMLL